MMNHWWVWLQMKILSNEQHADVLTGRPWQERSVELHWAGTLGKSRNCRPESLVGVATAITTITAVKRTKIVENIELNGWLSVESGFISGFSEGN
jgi:predicted alpha/beta hydrolase family esterase